MLEELIDRFGEPPKCVQNLLLIARLKSEAHRVYIKDITHTGEELKIVMFEHAKIEPARIPLLVQNLSPAMRFVMDTKNPYFSYILNANSREKNKPVLQVLQNLIEKMRILLAHEE